MDDLIKPAKNHRSINGTELVKAREKAGLSQKQLADRVGVSQQHIQHLEKPGEHEIPASRAELIQKAIKGE